MKKRLMIIGFLLMVIMAVVGTTTLKQKQLSQNSTAYYVIHSNMLKKSGGVTGIDIEGNATFTKSLKIQDVSEYSVMDNNFIAGGGRANNHLIIDESGNISEFYLLDNPNYSGVTAIAGDKGNLIAVMNGNVADNTYQNLLVIQDRKHNVLEKEIMDIYAFDMLVKNDIVYIVGAYLNVEENQWSSKIIKYNMKTKEIKEKIMSQDREYKKILVYDDKLYCIARDMNGRSSEIDILNKDSLNKIDTQVWSEEISDFFSYNDFLYYVLNNTLCKVEKNNDVIELFFLPEDTYVSSSMMRENHIYLFCRKNNIEKEKGKVDLGVIIDYDVRKNTSQSTPVKLEDKSRDNVLFFPILQQR